MSAKIPFPFPFTAAVQDCMAAALNFDAILQVIKTVSDKEVVRRADAGELADLEGWLERAGGLKVRRSASGFDQD
jgi:hypothetical protein